MAALHAFRPVALINAPILVAQLSVTVAHAIEPGAFVLNTLLRVDIGTVSMAQAVLHFPFVSGLIRPLVGAFASDLVF